MRTIYSAMILATALLAFGGNPVEGQLMCRIWVLDPPGPVYMTGSTCGGEALDWCTQAMLCIDREPKCDNPNDPECTDPRPICIDLPPYGPGCGNNGSGCLGNEPCPEYPGNQSNQNKGSRKPVVPSLISNRVLSEAVSVQIVSMKEKDGRLVIIADAPAGFPVDKLSTATHDVSVEAKNGRLEITLGKDGKFLGVRFEDMWPQRSAFSLSQNFPNPFNPATQVAYQLPEAGETTLAIYNTLGQRIRVLVQGRQEAGYYRVTWDGKDAYGQPVASGLYLYRLEAGPHAAARKMILAK